MVSCELDNNGPHDHGGHSLVVEADLELKHIHIYLLSILVIALRISQVKKARKKVPGTGKRMCRRLRGKQDVSVFEELKGSKRG